MANSLGALVVSLGLDAVELITGWTKAEYQAKKSLEAMTRSALGFQRTIKDVAAALGVGFSVRAFVGLIESTIEAADHLENLSKATGISVEQLGGLGFAAKQTGGDLDSMADAFKRFNVNAASAAAGNEKNLEVFNKLGITLEDLKTLTPDQLFIKAADAFASFNEGVNKSALGAAAFGKSYQAIIPTLDQGGQKLQENIEFFNKFGGVTTDVAQQASDFNTEMVKLNLLGGSFARALTADLLPPMKVLVEELLHAKENSNLFAIAAKFVADELTADAVTVLRLAQGYEQLQRAVGSAAERVKLFKSGEFSKALFSNLPDEEAGIERINKKYDDLINKVKNASNFPKVSDVADTLFPDLGPTKKRDAPGLRAGGADDPTRKLLEAELSAIKAVTAQEKAVLQNRDQFLQAEFDRGELSIEDVLH